MEADITVNGHKLKVAESLTLRVAVNTFLMDMKYEGLGNDAHGKKMTKLYKEHSKNILKYIHETPKSTC